MSVENAKAFAIPGKQMDVGGDLIKVRFWISYDRVNYISFQVLSMNENLRGKKVIDKLTDSNSEFTLSSQSRPDISSSGVFYVRGLDKAADDFIVTKVYTSAAERNKALNAFCVMLERVNQVAAQKAGGRNGEIIRADGIHELVVGSNYLVVKFWYDPSAKHFSATIIEQDERLRRNTTWVKNPSEPIGWRIESCSTPDIHGSTLYIRGDDRDADDRCFDGIYGSVEGRDSALNQFVSLIVELNNNFDEILDRYDKDLF